MLDGVICIRSKIACLYHDDETQRTWPEQRKCWFEPFKNQMSSEIYVAKHTARRVSMAGVEKKHFLFSRTNQAKPGVAFFSLKTWQPAAMSKRECGRIYYAYKLEGVVDNRAEVMLVRHIVETGANPEWIAAIPTTATDQEKDITVMEWIRDKNKVERTAVRCGTCGYPPPECGSMRFCRRRGKTASAARSKCPTSRVPLW